MTKKDNMSEQKGLDSLRFYQNSLVLWDSFWSDSEVLLKDPRGREIAIQLTRSVGSIWANIEEGYGRGYGKEYPRFLKISRGSAQESKGCYRRSKPLLSDRLIAERTQILDKIIASLTTTIATLYHKNKKD